MVNVSSFVETVFLDTAPLIYYIEGNSPYQPMLKRLFEANEKGYFKFITSAITLLEVLVKPLKMEETVLVEKYKNILMTAESIEVSDVSVAISIKAAEVRAKYNIHTPDAIQIATAILNNVAFFITNDLKLASVTELNVITLTEIE